MFSIVSESCLLQTKKKSKKKKSKEKKRKRNTEIKEDNRNVQLLTAGKVCGGKRSGGDVSWPRRHICLLQARKYPARPPWPAKEAGHTYGWIVALALVITVTMVFRFSAMVIVQNYRWKKRNIYCSIVQSHRTSGLRYEDIFPFVC